MMKYCALALSLCFSGIVADEAPKKQEADISKISESFGHLIGKNMETMGFKFDVNLVVKGLQDAADGKSAPLTEAECVQAISAIQETAFKQHAKTNLEKAIQFLAKNKKQKGVVALEEGKLQYKIEKKGDGQEVGPHFTPLIRYVGKYLDGSVFGSSKEDEVIALDEAIPGFSKGMLGMKEGEKRVLYIHPDLAYGTAGYLPPNSLLTFEVEIVKAQAPMGQDPESVTTKSHGKTPTESKEVVR